MKEWEKHYPDWNKTDKGQEEYMEICRIVLGGTTESELEKTRDLILEKLNTLKDGFAGHDMLFTILKVQQLVGEINNDADSN